MEDKTGFLLTRTTEGIPIKNLVRNLDIRDMGKRKIFDFFYKDNLGQTRQLESSYVEGVAYDAETDSGSCGGGCFVNSADFPTKLLGIHIGGERNGGVITRGYSILITQQWLESNLRGVSQAAYDVPLPEHADVTAGLMVEIPEYTTMELLGMADPKWQVRMPTKTEIRPSPIHGVFPPITEPSVLTPRDPRFDRANNPVPLQRTIDGYSKAVRPMRSSNLKRVVEAISWKTRFATADWKHREVLTLDQAVNGTRWSHMCKPMEMDTSPGLPWVKSRPPGRTGKKFLFEETIGDRGEPVWIAKQELRTAIEHRVEEARCGRRVVSVWYDMLKDERLPKKKIEIGNSRTFSIGPLDFNIAFRQYFGSMVWAMRTQQSRLSSKVGINPLGPDWTELWRAHKKVGEKCFAGDYSKFDRTVTGELIRQFAVMANDWYDDGPENAQIRMVLIDELYHRVNVVGNTLVLVGQGIPSGVPATSDIDGFVNEQYVGCMFCDLLELEDHEWQLVETQENWDTRDQNIVLSDMFEQSELSTYGDDLAMSVGDRIAPVLNFETYQYALSQYNIPFTAETKGEETSPLRTLEDVSFLKRRWVRDPVSGCQRAPLEFEVVQEELNWVRKSESDHEMVRVVADAALREAVHHGRDVFCELKKKINTALIAEGVKPLGLDYVDLERDWYKSLEMYG